MNFASSAILFTICRYVVYLVMFVRGLLAARFLGPYLLGVYGFLSLALQYLAYTGLGVQYAINVELATHPKSNDRDSVSAALSLTMLVALAIVLGGLAIQVFHVPLFAKFSFQRYALLVGIVAGTTLLQQVFINIYRVYGRLSRIVVGELFGAVLLLLLTLLYKDYRLISALLVGMAVSAAFAMVLFVIRAPFTFTFSLNAHWVRTLLLLGLPLLVYNASFYLITIVAQSIISIYYPLEAMGYYTLASSISNSALLGFNSIAWVAYPIVLGKTRMDLSDQHVARVADRVNVVFGTGVFGVVLIALLGLPLLFILLPRYEPARGAMTVLLLSQALLMSSFGYNCLAIARQRQMAIAKVSIASVGVVAVLAVLAGKAHLHFIWVSMAVLAGSVLFSLLQAWVGSKVLGGAKLRCIVPPGSIATIALCLVGVVIAHPFVGVVAGVAVYFTTNRDRISEVWQLCWPYVQGLWGLQAPVVAVKEHI